MSKLDISFTKKTEISVDGKYCDTTSLTFCKHLHCAFLPGRAQCVLFGKSLDHCLGGGPLRCAACLEAEKQITEPSVITDSPTG